MGLLAAGRSSEEILRAYPYLEQEDIDQAPSLLSMAGQRTGSSTAQRVNIKLDSWDLVVVVARAG